MTKTKSLLIGVVALTLASCGGGGGDPGNNAATTTLVMNVIQDGHTDGVSMTTVGVEHYVGDDVGGNDFRVVMRFPLAAIPPGSNIVGAFVYIPFLTREGTPAGNGINNLGDLQFVRIDGSAPLSIGDYNAPALALDPQNNLAVDLPNSRPRIGLLTPLLSAVAAGDTHLKLRLQYQMTTNANGVSDGMQIAGITHPTEIPAQLEVVTQP